MEIIYLIIGLTIGVIIGCLIINGSKKSLEGKYQALVDNMAAKEVDNKDKLAEVKALNDKLISESDKRHKEAVGNMQESFKTTIDSLETKLKSVTEELLKARQQEFADSSKNTMKDIIEPLNDTIAKMKEKMEGYTEKQQEFSGSIKTHLDSIKHEAQRAYESASELTTALKHDTKVQGDYGEVILDQLLASQGLKEGYHYDVQYVERDENGRELKDEAGVGRRPDVVVHLDGKRDVIIDSKMNLTDFIAYANAKTPEERNMYLEKHIKSMEAQVKLLSSKNYTKYHKNTQARMDFVLMFVPISAALWEALRYKPTLWQESLNQGVYIVDEQTLNAALRIVRLTWTQIDQVENQDEIFKLANTMIERVELFLEEYKKIGTALKSMSSAYENGLTKLQPNGYSITTTARKLIDKGAKYKSKGYLAAIIDVDDVAQLEMTEE